MLQAGSGGTGQRSGTLGMYYDNTTGAQALEKIRASVEGPAARARSVVFVNVHSVLLGRRDPAFMRRVNEADLVLPDGSGLAIAGRLNGDPVKENLNGTDFTPRVLRVAAEKKWSVFLLGARREVVEQCRRNIDHWYAGVRVAGLHPGFFTREEEEGIVAEINATRPDLLLVAMGSPLQEEWIARHQDRLHARVCMAVGGFFDFLSGIRPRAPLWLRKLGLEFVYRFVHDPRGKWERLFVEIPWFLVLVLGEYLFGTRRQAPHARPASPGLETPGHNGERAKESQK
jgi:N-acetylglucosaminyldiphosphoundecaprenol N-acetyl-beta-D-mannosaminyltransferase